MRFLVVSYDDDQQQWFYDFAEAPTEKDAVAHICRIRPYVMAADACTIDQMAGMLGELQTMTPEKIRRDLARIKRASNALPGTFANESDEAECQNCGETFELSDLKPIKDIHQRVQPGESMPAGECPDCGALCQLREQRHAG